MNVLSYPLRFRYFASEEEDRKRPILGELHEGEGSGENKSRDTRNDVEFDVQLNFISTFSICISCSPCFHLENITFIYIFSSLQWTNEDDDLFPSFHQSFRWWWWRFFFLFVNIERRVHRFLCVTWKHLSPLFAPCLSLSYLGISSFCSFLPFIWRVNGRRKISKRRGKKVWRERSPENGERRKRKPIVTISSPLNNSFSFFCTSFYSFLHSLTQNSLSVKEEEGMKKC